MNRFLLLFVIFLPSCLAFSKRYNDLLEDSTKYDTRMDSVRAEQALLQSEYDSLALRVVRMTHDTLRVASDYRKLLSEYNRVLEYGSSELASNQRQLHESKSQYMVRLQALDQIEAYVKTREYSLNGIQARCEEAMRRYRGSGVVVDREGGAVVIYIPDQLLFDSTEYKLSDSGRDFAQSLGRMISFQRNISVMVGGHAPGDLELLDSEFGDAWDMSAWRAVAITRELLKMKAITAKHIYAAGHGAWGFKGDDSGIKSGKTEIIITPILEEVTDVMDRAINR